MSQIQALLSYCTPSEKYKQSGEGRKGKKLQTQRNAKYNNAQLCVKCVYKWVFGL